MRGLFWTRLGPKEVQGTVWQDVVPNLQLTVSDREELEKAFGATATSTSHLSPIKDVEGERAKTQPVALLDAKRTQGILIVLGKLRMSPNQILETLVTVRGRWVGHSVGGGE